ncbi:MAG: Rnase Y domain-containing protein, partial [Peptococcus niger]
MDLTIIAVGLIALIIGCAVGYVLRKQSSEKMIGSAEAEAKRVVDEAARSAETLKKEALVEAKDDAYKIRNEAEQEARERRAEVQNTEKRLMQKEDILDRKSDSLEQKEEKLLEREQSLLDSKNDVDRLIEEQKAELERIAGLTNDEAKNQLFRQVEAEIDHDLAVMIKEKENNAKDEADKIAREIIGGAIQRCAADHVAETTVSVVQLPNDEMKGRIIGREGRNIRTIESMTGVDLIIDDTPEA